MPAPTIPSPPGLPLLGHLLAFRRDVLSLMLRARHAHGDLVRLKLGPLTFHLLSHPDDVEAFFRDHHSYDKNTAAFRELRALTGDGLLITNGETWERQRRLMQPSFSAARMSTFVTMMATATQRMLNAWPAPHSTARPHEPFDVASQMMRLTYRIIEKALFSTDSDTDLDAIESAVTIAMRHVYARIGRPINLPRWLPTPANLRFNRALGTLDRRVYEIIEEHRAAPGKFHDLLSALMSAQSGHADQPLKDDALAARELRDQTVSLLLSGHETTANALTWLWYLLWQHDDIAQRVRDEAIAVLGDRLPTADDLPKLTYTAMVIKETLRLYTPIWLIDRRVLRDVQFRGCRIPAGTRLVVSPYVVHRHPQFWDSPDRFDPSRFEPAKLAAMHPQQYIPFGGGPRYCIGQHLARTEALVITAMIARRFRLTLAPGHRVETEPGITLRSRHGMRMIANRWENS